MTISWSKSVYNSVIKPSIPLKADSKITIAAEVTTIPTTEIQAIMETAGCFCLESKYRFAM
jgi:hypothetical protein